MEPDRTKAAKTPHPVLVSIVAHPSGELAFHAGMLDQCLKSLRTAAPRRGVRVVLTNNLGGVDLFGALAELDGTETLVSNPQPAGFAANHNRALAQTGEPYAFILNDDTLVAHESLDRLADVLDASPRVGMVGPRVYRDAEMLLPEPSVGLRIITPERALLWRLMRETPLIGRPGLRGIYSELSTSERAMDALHLQGAAMLVRREAYDQAGGMDEGYGMYREETDLCLEMRSRGWRIRHEPAAAVVHFGGSSTGSNVYREQYQTSLNRFLGKHFGWRHRLVNGLLEPPLLGSLRLLRKALARRKGTAIAA